LTVTPSTVARSRDALHLGGVTLLSPGHDVAGVSVRAAADGFTLQAPDSEPHLLPWTRIEEWWVTPWDAPGQPGACVTVLTDVETYHLAVHGGDPVELHRLVADVEQAPPAASAPTGPAATGDPVPAGFARIRPLLVVALVVVLVVAVALVLAQSGGLIHLPYLGGDATIDVGSVGLVP
jgi:hypothetical protein